MTKEYKDAMREDFEKTNKGLAGFKNYEKLKNGEYLSSYAEKEWFKWKESYQAACKWATAQQIEKDAGICEEYLVTPAPVTINRQLAEIIRNQEES